MESRTLGKTGFSCFPIGFGGYRLEEGNSQHEEALRLAIDSGVNLIDTSANYGDGGSERLIGKVLRELPPETRSRLFLVTKAGYVQGENMRIARERIRDGKPFTEMVQLQSDLWHCISPDFLEDQLTRSLERLGQKQVDALLLHNPEYYLKKHGDHAEYYRRIRQAFIHLEAEAKRGRIRFYGVSSNTFPEPKESDDFTSLEALLEISREIGTEHFALIQCPFNLLEAGAALADNQGGRSTFELARSNALGVLSNRPLNAFFENELLRLASFPEEKGPHPEFKVALKTALAIEARLPAEAGVSDVLEPSRLGWAHILKDHLAKIQSIDQWEQIRRYQIEPSLEDGYAALERAGLARAWRREHRQALDEAFAAFARDLRAHAGLVSRQIELALDRASPSLARSRAPLSQKALRTYISVPGLSCVLLGMRKPEYVRDALAAAAAAELPEPEWREALLNAGRFL